jgi:hypothetical protein
MTRITVALLLLAAGLAGGWLLAVYRTPPPASPADPVVVTAPVLVIRSTLPDPTPATAFLRVECWHKQLPSVPGAKIEEGPAASQRVRVTRLADKFEFFTLTNAKGHAEVWLPPSRYAVWMEFGMPAPEAVEIDVSAHQINTVKLHALTLGV